MGHFVELIRREKILLVSTVKPALSGHRIKQTPSFKGTVAEVPKIISLIYFKCNLRSGPI